MKYNKINARAVILDILMQIDKEHIYSHRALDTAFKKHTDISRNDRALISKVVHGTLERELSIDYIIAGRSSVKLNKLKPVILHILRMSVYQIMYMDRIPDRAICDEAVKLTVKRGLRGLKGFVNGILRNISRDKEDIVYPDMQTKYSMPDWIIDILSKEMSDKELRGVLASFLEDKKLSIRVNTSRISVQYLIKELRQQNIDVMTSQIYENMLNLSGFESLADIACICDGRAFIQDAGSALVCSLAGIQKGDTVLDVCAAPGGKSIHAADILDGSGQVIACDISESKVSLIRENIEKSGFKNISTCIRDARVYDAGLYETADVLIADLPCSGLGIIGRKPDIKKNVSIENIMELVKLQRNILDNIVKYVKIGGKLVYSTCTMSPYENTENRDYILQKYPEFKPVDISGSLAKCILKDTAGQGYIQLMPGICNNDGFFISLYEKRS